MYSWHTSPTTTGTTTPRTLLRVRIDTQSASAAKPMTPGSTLSQLTATSASAAPGDTRVLPTLMKSWPPTHTSPASSALAPMASTTTTVALRAANTLPQNTDPRATERVRIVL